MSNSQTDHGDVTIDATFRQSLSGTVHTWRFALNPVDTTAHLIHATQGGEHYSLTALPPSSQVQAALSEMGYTIPALETPS